MRTLRWRAKWSSYRRSVSSMRASFAAGPAPPGPPGPLPSTAPAAVVVVVDAVDTTRHPPPPTPPPAVVMLPPPPPLVEEEGALGASAGPAAISGSAAWRLRDSLAVYWANIWQPVRSL